MTARSVGWLSLVAGIALIGLVAAGAGMDEGRSPLQSFRPIPAPVAPAVRMLADGLTLVVVPQPRVPRVSMALVFPRGGAEASVAASTNRTTARTDAEAETEAVASGARTSRVGSVSEASDTDTDTDADTGTDGGVAAAGDVIVDVVPVLRALLDDRGAPAADGLRAAAFRLGGELAVRAEPDSVALTLSVPANEMERGLALLARVVRAPTAGSPEMSRLAAIVGQATPGSPFLPAGRGQQALWRTVFRVQSAAGDERRSGDADAPPSSASGGDHSTVPRDRAKSGNGRSQADDVRVRAVFARVLRPDAATLIVTGTTDETRAAQAVSDAFRGWGDEANRIRASGVSARPFVAAKHVARTSLLTRPVSEARRTRAELDTGSGAAAGGVRILLIDRPGSVQASLWFGSAVQDVVAATVPHQPSAAAGGVGFGSDSDADAGAAADADAGDDGVGIGVGARAQRGRANADAGAGAGGAGIGVRASTVAGAEVPVARQAAQRAAMEMANALCAASPSGRVFRRLVEEEGISYGPYSRVTPVRGALFFTLSVDAGNPVAARALEETLRVLQALRETTATPREIEAARRFVQGQALLRVSSQASIVSELTTLVGTGGDARRLGALAQAAQTIRAADVQASARQLWDPARLAIVVIGDANVLTPSFSQIGRVERFVP